LSARAHARWLAPALAFAFALAPVAGHAEPGAIRGPDLGNSVVFVVGAPESSRAVWLRPYLAITQEVRVPYDAFGLGVGLRRSIVGGPRGWAWDAQIGAGFLVPTLLPGVALTLTPSTSLRLRGEWAYFSMGLVAPMAARLNAPNDVRLPVQGELWLAFRVGPLWIGAMTAIGATFSPGANAALLIQGAGYIAIPYGPGRERR
jgi:hypothetical protein